MLLTAQIVVLEYIFLMQIHNKTHITYRLLLFYAWKLYFCRSWTSESCVTI